MRPEILFPLFAKLDSLKGVGPRIAALMEKAAGPHVVDLLWHLPREIIDRRDRPTVAAALPGKIVTLTVRVGRHEAPSDRRRPYRIHTADDTGNLILTYFRGDRKYLEQILPPGETRIVSGRLDLYNGIKQMAHPDHVQPLDRADEIPGIEAVYPLTQGITPKVLAKAIHAALDRAPEMPEWLDDAFLKQREWPTWRQAITTAHAPEGSGDLSPLSRSRLRLAYDELLANQLALTLVRMRAKRQGGQVIKGDGSLRRRVESALPFALTGSQITALSEIYGDMASPHRMLRLLQGDVGSGKTVVALLAMLNAVETGGQAALMAPTEILARQHFDTIAPLLTPLGLKCVVLTGRDKGAVRRDALAALAEGSAKLAIGTHALFQDDVEFRDLKLAVIDEQHRFGVHQRLTLGAKGAKTDMLVMTATPIPRTLTMTAYGDLDSSRLTDKPPGRKPIKTVVVAHHRLTEVVDGLTRKLREGAKIYWVCPLVEESETNDLANAEGRHADLIKHFGEDRVALVHGRMKGKEKDAAMDRFVNGPGDILVATTVIEVGVNVPAATVMVIEQAERFGLAQLHQLRGRIGRGDAESTCILVRSEELTQTARERLRTLSETEDGFVIAEKDLELRGAGEILGTKQSGLPEFRLADIALHGELMRIANDDAKLVLERDPDLTGDRGKRLRLLLYLFERDAAIANLKSG
ncbi:ATP-dependent DNA helicase RecG [Rhodospirillaceae bacterium KN72]|uniref:ATP-dependent DNA helicase RecG n=1 Tax=Pacificispira spongiicola TaxID=2729598 RepID=A0A7Y0HDJ8_9PROT|nr:ATP-dependent DNA helicase RecG [Pacificispira spongiicola]NMM43896.1 ATP-dependent DNA helicase RecG [Pacificispira spongiicola]